VRRTGFSWRKRERERERERERVRRAKDKLTDSDPGGFGSVVVVLDDELVGSRERDDEEGSRRRWIGRLGSVEMGRGGRAGAGKR